MTDRELFEQALEALEYAVPFDGSAKTVTLALTALHERLAQPERVNQCAETCERAKLCATCARALDEQPEQEPMAWISEGGDVSRSKRYMDEMGFKCNPLYTAPQRREWVGLTLDEKKGLNDALNLQGRFPIIDAIEAAIKEKNNG